MSTRQKTFNHHYKSLTHHYYYYCHYDQRKDGAFKLLVLNCMKAWAKNLFFALFLFIKLRFILPQNFV